MPSRHLFIIRIALFAGVATFAALVLYQRSQGIETLGTGEPAIVNMMRYALWALSGTAVAAALFLRSRVESASPTQRGVMTVIGWALGEGVALFGVVLHFVGGPVRALAIGVLTFVVVLILLPVPQERT